MRLPDFLIIGAMKSGTTTLWADLGRHPDVFMPAIKEPETLGLPDAATERGKRRYAALLRKAGQGQVCGEASTLYTKLPHSVSIAARARALLGDDVRLIYIVREPIGRAVSHHKHLWRRRQAAADFDRAARQHPEIIEYGCYARQIDPWLAQFDRRQLLVLRFEDLIVDRQEAMVRVLQFLGLPQTNLVVDDHIAFNPGDVETVLHIPGLDDWFYRVRVTPAYQRLSELALVRRLKAPVKAWFQRPLPAGPPSGPSAGMLAELAERYEEDAQRLAERLGWRAPVWDFGQWRK